MKKILLLLSVAALALTLVPATDASAYSVGTLKVTLAADSTHSYATVFVDGVRKGMVYRGRTAQYGGIPTGNHVIKIRNGNDERTTSVHVYRNRVAEVTMTFAQQLNQNFQRGTLRMHVQGRSRISAAIYINDKYCFNVNGGQTRSIALRAGRTYTIKAVYGGRQFVRQATVHAGRVAITEFRF